MITKAERVLAEGLQKGYAGQSQPQKITHGPFEFTSNELITPNSLYRDEWIAKHTSAGQEVAKSGDEVVTRVYAGGIVTNKELDKLGISEKEVLGYLKTSLMKYPETRLHSEINSTEGDWRYEYKKLHEFPEVSLSIGLEQIFYKDTVVFVHAFLNTPII